MDELTALAELIRRRNAVERDISAITGRPALIGHVGEFIASRIFAIELEQSVPSYIAVSFVDFNTNVSTT